MRHPSLDITDEQEANLRKLAAYLMTQVKPEQFGMASFMENGTSWDSPRIVRSCGTVACAAGYGPTAGVSPLKDEDWCDYTSRAFVQISLTEWSWCFDEDWRSLDNTPTGAGTRILYMLELGVPDDWDYEGKYEDLPYANWTPEEYLPR